MHYLYVLDVLQSVYLATGLGLGLGLGSGWVSVYVMMEVCVLTVDWFRCEVNICALVCLAKVTVVDGDRAGAKKRYYLLNSLISLVAYFLQI